MNGYFSISCSALGLFALDMILPPSKYMDILAYHCSNTRTSDIRIDTALATLSILPAISPVPDRSQDNMPYVEQV
jgi:hypothetical protein